MAPAIVAISIQGCQECGEMIGSTPGLLMPVKMWHVLLAFLVRSHLHVDLVYFHLALQSMHAICDAFYNEVIVWEVAPRAGAGTSLHPQ